MTQKPSDVNANLDYDDRSSFEIDGTPHHNVSGNSCPPPSVKLGFRKGMVIASLNVNSLPAHKDEVETLLKDQGIHILALNETKIDDNYPSDLLRIDGYRFVRHDRNRDGDGVGFYISNTIVADIRDDLLSFLSRSSMHRG